MKHIRNRYERLKSVIGNQVKLLQDYEPFCKKCVEFYNKGYKDWLILSAIFNCMLTWKTNELGWPNGPSQAKFQAMDLQNKLTGQTYPAEKFLEIYRPGQETEIDIAIEIFVFAALKTHDFDVRQQPFSSKIAEEFLKTRLNFFEPDLPHIPIFGTPRGNWPETI